MSIVLSPEEIQKVSSYFWARVEKPKQDSPNVCWLWTGYKDEKDGYGSAYLSRIKKYRMMPAHRLSWIIHVGNIPPGRLICHSCDVPACVKIDHLWLGTQRHNLIDARNKGRKGNFLTEAQIKQVAERYKNGESAVLIDLDYKISYKTIYNYMYILKKNGMDFGVKKVGRRPKDQKLGTSGQQRI